MEGDYRNPQHYQPGNPVEQSHFTPADAYLINKQVIGGIGYTLSRFPNHHKALYAMMRNDRAGTAKRSPYSMDCWLTRAVYFAPDDEMVHMLYGIYHQWNSDLEKSKEEYLKALELKPNDPQINYNLGLLYVEMGDYENASKRAEVAYSSGYPLEGLRKKLEKMSSNAGKVEE